MRDPQATASGTPRQIDGLYVVVVNVVVVSVVLVVVMVTVVDVVVEVVDVSVFVVDDIVSVLEVAVNVVPVAVEVTVVEVTVVEVTVVEVAVMEVVVEVTVMEVVVDDCEVDVPVAVSVVPVSVPVVDVAVFVVWVDAVVVDVNVFVTVVLLNVVAAWVVLVDVSVMVVIAVVVSVTTATAVVLLQTPHNLGHARCVNSPSPPANLHALWRICTPHTAGSRIALQGVVRLIGGSVTRSHVPQIRGHVRLAKSPSAESSPQASEVMTDPHTGGSEIVSFVHGPTYSNWGTNPAVVGGEVVAVPSKHRLHSTGHVLRAKLPMVVSKSQNDGRIEVPQTCGSIILPHSCGV